jgi:AraC-like DNA-binding protein
MVKSPSVRRSADFDPHQSKGSRAGEGSPFKQAFEAIAKVMPALVEAVVVTTMPRGSLQLAQPATLSESLLKGYAREFHLSDRLTWQAVLGRKPVTAAQLGGSAKFVHEFLVPAGFAHAVAVPLEAPIIEGYPGALHVYRRAEDGGEGAFSPEEMRTLQDIAGELNERIRQLRQARKAGSTCAVDVSLTPKPTVRQFVFDADARELFAPDEFAKLDERLRENVLEHIRGRLSQVNGQLVSSDRVQIPDSSGDLWTFRVVVYTQYPAVAERGPVVILCMQPTCGEWGAVRPSDLQADSELARLIPAIKFMKSEFHRGPTLGEIAKTVHLSPFHFHRRFAELLGMTPKHYLLECQIHEAKVQLLARRKDLSQIATDCGFAHQSHFTSRFKQATGLTPTRWRRLAEQAKHIGESN